MKQLHGHIPWKKLVMSKREEHETSLSFLLQKYPRQKKKKKKREKHLRNTKDKKRDQTLGTRPDCPSNIKVGHSRGQGEKNPMKTEPARTSLNKQAANETQQPRGNQN